MKTELELKTLRVTAAISANEDTPAVDLEELDGDVCIHAYWDTGVTNNFDVFLETSNDGVNWVQVTSSSINITSAAGAKEWDNVTTVAKWIRVGIERTAGSMNLGVNFSGRREKK